MSLVSEIEQRLTGAAQKAAGPKVQTAATNQNVGGDDVVEEATALLAASPPAWPWALSAFLILAVGALIAYYVWKWIKPTDFMPSSNYATYAGLFIMALAIERILEPFSGLFVPTMKAKKAISRSTVARAKHVQTAAAGSESHATDGPTATGSKSHATDGPIGTAGEEPKKPPKGTPTQQAAVAQAHLHRSQGIRAVLMWATASVLAMLACASLGIFLVRSVGAPASPAKTSATSSASSTANGPNRVLDLLVTGLVVGAGTKPLHDLITQIQTSSSSSKAKASSPTATS
jgi:hypothetical protein